MAEDPNTALRDPLQEPAWLRALLIGAAVLSMALLVVLPLAMVLASAFGDGFRAWWEALAEPDALSALRLTLFTAAIVIPINAVFGVFAAWALTRFEFRGKRVLLAFIDLPFAVSPNSTRPLSACSRPAMTRSSVVLPEPDGPSNATSSPEAMSRSMPSSAATPG